MENTVEGLTFLRSGAPFVDSLVQQEFALKGDCYPGVIVLAGLYFALINCLSPIPSAPRHSDPQVELLSWMALLLFP